MAEQVAITPDERELLAVIRDAKAKGFAVLTIKITDGKAVHVEITEKKNL